MNRFDRLFWRRLGILARPYWVSEKRVLALTLLAVVLLLSGLIQAAGVVFSYVNRDMMTALADRDGTTFFRKMVLVVIYNLILNWRRWLTERFLDQTFHDRAFYRISSDARIDNPDQRVRRT